MSSDELKFPDVETLTMLSGLPEGMRAHDIIEDLQKEMIRLGKPEKEAIAIKKRLIDAFAQERDKAVEACYMAGYLKGSSDMAQRFRGMLEARGELHELEEHKHKAA